MKSAEVLRVEQERVERIATMMINGQWQGGASKEQLAAEWDIHERTVGQFAIMASLQLERKGQPIEELIGERIAELDNIKRQALEDAKPDYKAAIGAIKLIMDIRGVTLARKPSKADPPKDGYDNMKPKELIALHQKAIAELQQNALAEEESSGDEGNGVH